MRVTVVGSGTGLPAAGRGGPAVLVEGSAEALLVDAGAGSLRGVAAAGVDPRRVSAIVLTHLHMDHAGELAAWLFAFRNPSLARREPLTVAGGPGLADHVEGLRRLWGRQVEMPVPLEVVELTERSLESADFSLETFPVSHIPSSLGLRLTERGSGAVLAVSGDAERCPGLAELGREADLFILECSLPEAPPGSGHLDPRGALAVVSESRCRRALLTHFYPGWDPAAALAALGAAGRLGRDILLAEDGLTLDIGAPATP